ncbi:MAG TPA: Ig-like domain-containing protein [Burkholderiales bacterium]|nr:Ig-like domain-containing protein [Burkholderiales bacterium]
MKNANKAAVLLAICCTVWISSPARAQLLGNLVVTMTVPESGSTVAGSVPVSASVSIIGALTVAGVQFKLDGANLGAEDTSAPYSVSWNTATAGNGTHTLSAVARDGLLGLTFTSASVTVTVNNAPPPDTTPPTVSIAAPANGATLSATVAVSASAADNVGVAGVQFRLDGANLGAEDASAPYSVSWNTATVGNGTHTLSAIARDAAGNRTTSAAVTVTVNNAPPPDTTPPTVSITAPANGATVKGTVTLTASATDNVGVVGVQFLGDGMALGAEDTTAPYSVSIDTTATSNGSHILTAVARDAAGNRTTSAPVTVTVNNTVPDTTPPTVSITAPANGATVKGTVNLTANAADNVGVAGVQFFGDGMALGAEDTAAPYSISIDTTTSSNGPHTLTAVARDAAGNHTTSAPVTVTVNNTAPDTTPPTVGITAPANGATVSGTVTLSASASDNVGVVGVQFFGDGIALGVEDTTAPYSISVDTTASPNGPHTLTAVARDAAGNTTTSAPVSVAVANGSAPATRRFEETDPSIAYTSGWSSDAQGGLSGGTAAVTNAVGAQATFTFTGTSVSWIGGRSVQTGIAQVFLDGNMVSQIDTFSKTAEVQVPMFTATGLTDASHTLTIQATGQKNAAAQLAFIIVDAFDVPAATISRLQDTDPVLTYTGGGWVHGDTSDLWSGGTSSASVTAGDQVTFTFNGTGIRWLGARGPQNGIASVSLDGTFVSQVSTLGTGDSAHAQQVQSELFKAAGLAEGAHTLTIQVTGQKEAAATAAIVNVDAFDVTTSRTRHEDTDPAITYTGGWVHGNIDHPYSEGTAALSTASNDQATFVFTGTSVSWIGFRGPQGGIARVLVDGNLVAGGVDTYSPTEGPQNVLFSQSGLASGSHTLTIQAMGTSNPASSGTAIVVDAFDVTP